MSPAEAKVRAWLDVTPDAKPPWGDLHALLAEVARLKEERVVQAKTCNQRIANAEAEAERLRAKVATLQRLATEIVDEAEHD